MASVGHIAVGIATARAYRAGAMPRWSSMAWWSALSLLPDADVIGFSLGVDYGDPWGHRGATHSLALSVALGLAMGVAARWFNRPVIRTAIVASLVLASHAVLDTMTDGGLGCALFWPFDLTRYFAPWRPIPVAPIGLSFLSLSGAIVALIELVLFSPLLLFTLRSRSARAKPVLTTLFLALWSISVWLTTSDDPIRDAAVGLVLRDDTVYTSGFSEETFRTITENTPQEEVRRLLGPPRGESWFYSPRDQPFQSAMTRAAASLPTECIAVRFEAGVVVTALEGEACRKLGIREGNSFMDVERLLGAPTEACWRYSWSPRNGRHRMRMVCLQNGKVEKVFRRWS